MNRQSSLCLACSSSLPPAKCKAGSSSSTPDSTIYMTRCCSRPICPACILSNPRLARYDPCLACLGGVGVVNTVSTRGNLDGSVRDEDTYVIGDDDDGDDGEGNREEEDFKSTTINDVPSVLSLLSAPISGPAEENGEVTGDDLAQPFQYYIKRSDTLRGIALRFGVDGREICRLNNLPPSTLTTTPHILHTRIKLTLPDSMKRPVELGELKSTPDKEKDARRARERAEKRLQTLTKEVDWRVAKAYVSLADDEDAGWDHDLKRKEEAEAIRKITDASLEGRAVDHYLDDEEWEQNERREGRSAAIPPFPYIRSVASNNNRAGVLSWGWRR